MRFVLTLPVVLVLAACGPDADAPKTAGSAAPAATTTAGPTDVKTAAPAGQAASPADRYADGARRIEADVRFLADDLLEGREAGTRGYELAARYVAARFDLLGLEPAGEDGTFFQKVPMVRGKRVAGGAAFEVVSNGNPRALAFKADFMPGLAYTAKSFDVTAPVVFVGHGVHAPELGYDDFAKVDVKGKIALVFSNAPAKFPNDQRAFYSSSATKSRELEARGAVGIVYLGDPKEEKKRSWDLGVANWERVGMRLVDASGVAVDDFPGLKARSSVRAGMVDALLEGSGRKAADLFAALEAGTLESFELPIQLHLAGRGEFEPVESRNVVARLRGSDAKLAEESVAFTAHLDHVGTGAAVEGDTIYNGAVDNALGIAIMLEAARELAAAERPKRSILFVAVTAEEKGLLGAEHFARNPTVAKGSIVANVNMDMPILLQPQEDVVPTGVEHSSLEAVLAQAAKDVGVKISPDPIPEEVIFIRSDQYAFIKQGIPAVFLNGGVVASPGATDPGASLREFLTRHYHLPSDETDLSIHYPTAARLAHVNERIGAIVANDPQRPTWKAGDFFGEKFGKAGAQAGAAAPASN